MPRFPAILAGCLLFATPIAAEAQQRAPRSSAPVPASASAGVSDQAIARAIRDKASGPVKEFYAQRGYWPIWVEDGQLSPAANRFFQMVITSHVDGLDPRDYNPGELTELIRASRGGRPEDLARAEVKLSREFARFVQDMRKPNAEMLYFDPAVRPTAMKEDEVLRRAALAESMPDYIASMGWMSPYYAGLRQALASAVSGGRAELPVVPEGPLLREGASGARVALLRERLGLTAGDDFDEELADAVRLYQEENGLSADGVVGRQTVAALNARPKINPEVLQINLERARLLPSPGTRHIVVNTASAQLTYYDDGREEGSMRVIVGTSQTPTPMMAGTLRYATLNPYWNVPVSLVRKTIAPAVLKGASLHEMGYEVLSDWTADASIVNPDTVDWNAAANGGAEPRVRELPGSGNAMGSVKYMFPNDLGIYLHDTPNRALFKKDARQFSNGCVRLEDAEALGRWLFGTMPGTASSEPEQHIPLPEPVAVYLTYLTAVPTSGGNIAYFDDVYRRDFADTMLASRE